LSNFWGTVQNDLFFLFMVKLNFMDKFLNKQQAELSALQCDER
jgi:hypothetical protein